MIKKSTLMMLFALGTLIFTGTIVPKISGQTVSGTLRGTISDSNGAVIPNATITVRNKETGLERTVTSSGEGLYNMPFLPIGVYDVEVSRTDFNKVIRTDVRVTLNENTVVNVELNPGVTGEVTVTDETPPINTTNAQIAGTLTSAQIEERPVANQGNFLTLAETFTGFQENPTSGQNNPTASSGSSVNFNGTGTRGATFQINGVNNDDSSENQNRQGASLATVKAFQVITNNFTAEFGRGYGAVVLVQTLSGTNSFRGSLYNYHNDQALNAKNFFSNRAAKKPVTRRNQYGGVLGFPIFKNKLFGFISVDRVENSGANTYTRDLPLPFERNPANWFTITPANNTPANRAFIQSVLNRFPTDLVPNDSRSPRTFVGSQPFSFPAMDYSARFDWNIGQKDTVFARWQYTRQRFQADDIILGERADQNNKQQNYGATWTHIFSPTVVGEFRYGLGLRTTLVNIAAGNDTPVIRFQNPHPVVGSSIIGNAGNFPIQRYQTDNQFVYNLSMVFGGNHFVKTGVDFRRQQLDDLADNFSRGFYTFNGLCNGVTYRDPTTATPTVPLGNPSGFHALINGCVSTFQKGYGPFFLENRINEDNVYIEDNWKVTQDLTLNLGLRYEYVMAPREAANRIDYGFGNDKDNIEPRIGFAYSPSVETGMFRSLFGAPGDSSIRGGYGIYHGRLFQSVFSQSGATVRFNPPNALFYNQTGVGTAQFAPNNLADPTNGFVFTPGPQASRHSIAIIDPNLEMPYTQQWNLTIERKLPWSTALRASYTGNRAIGLVKFGLDNLPVHDPVNGVRVADHPNNPASLRGQIIRLAADAFCAGTTTVNTLCPNVVPIAANEYSRVVPRINERRPDGRYGTNTTVTNGAWSYYNGLQIEFIKRLSHGFNFSAAYTWSKSIDTNSEATAVGTGDSNQNGNDARVSRGHSRFHTPHRFTFFGTYRLPFFATDNGWKGSFLGGWQLSAVYKAVHGTPFTVSGTAIDLNFDGFSEVRPVLVDPSILGNSISNPQTSQQLLPLAAFRSPTSLSDYNCCILGRNTFYMDGVNNIDLAFSKIFKMPWEGHSLYFRADMFNAFNHFQWGFPNVTYTSTTLGVLSTAATQYAPRNVQLSLKYTF
jgi:Carboxypeptidase regulatory-like domain/TonB dependent receptor